MKGERTMKKYRLLRIAAAGLAGALGLAAAAPSVAAAASRTSPAPSFLSHFSTVANIASTVPANGDVNPYGIVVVPQSTGQLVAGDTLISNFNNSANLQGTGSTIVEVAPSGAVNTFAHLSGPLPGARSTGVGLTTALAVLPGGWVVVGNLPTTDGTSATATAGSLIVLNSAGVPVETWTGRDIRGPWDLASESTGDRSEIFVSNVLNGTVAHSPATVDGGTVIRLDVLLNGNHAPQLQDTTVIARGFAERTDANALVVGRTGLALGHGGQLFAADSVNSRIAEIPDALRRLDPVEGGGITVSSGGALNDPLGLTLAPNGDILSVNGGDGNIVETTPSGQQLDTQQIDPAGSGGDLFGVTVAPRHEGVLFVDDGDNTLKSFGPPPASRS
jgi:hypothetical protein